MHLIPFLIWQRKTEVGIKRLLLDAPRIPLQPAIKEPLEHIFRHPAKL